MRRSVAAFGRFLASALALLALIVVSAGGSYSEDRSTPGPEAILGDGLEALDDNQTARARNLFESLMTSYPGTPEAGRAALELEAMSAVGAAAGEEPPAAGSAPRATGEGGGIAEFRQDFLMDVGDRVFFAEASAEIGGRARAVIDHQARWLNKHTSLIVTIIGRADDGGSAAGASDLSKRRAEAVRDRLITGGVEANRIMVEARGDRDPLALCRSAQCQAQNRHAETMIGDPTQAGEPGRGAR